jgi:hypothetical protein
VHLGERAGGVPEGIPGLSGDKLDQRCVEKLMI